MTTEVIWKIVRILSVLGLVLSIYLLFEQVSHSPFQPCNINSFINCNAVISGSVSKILGISTPLFGLIGYIVIFLSSIFKTKKILLAMAGFGLLFCLWIAYQELFLLRVLCPVCILCQLDMITTFILALVLLKKGGG